MSLINAYTNKRFLILDDLPEMRSSLRSQIGSLGCENIAVSGTVKDALELFRESSFDVVLCDYYLSGGTDGQQFLEYLRTRKLIGRGVLFIMVTAEKGYESVVTAAECLPDDYLLKPFTAEILKIRLERLLEKKQRLLKVDQLQDKGDWAGVVRVCEEIIASRDRYLVDAMRIKGNALLMAGQAAKAADFYAQTLNLRPMPWARLGLARALAQTGETARCKETLTSLIAESPRLMAAYDLLGKVQMSEGKAGLALETLDRAREISPNSLARHRAIAGIAEAKGDFVRVEHALAQVVQKTRNSPLRETEDIARLGNALVELGDPAKAVSLLEEARTNFKSDADHPLLAAVEAIAQQQTGQPEKAAAALARATKGELASLPPNIAMTVAKACLVNGQTEAAQGIYKSLVQNNPESEALHNQISAALDDAGAAGLAQDLVASSIREVIHLNNEAVRKAKAGELSEAAAMLTDAAQRLPGNMQVVANASAALLAEIFTHGIDPVKLRQAQSFQRTLQEKAPMHPKLAEIASLMQRIRDKYLAGA